MKQINWRILLVDDDEDDYVIVRQMLADAREGKFALEWASTYEAGHEALASYMAPDSFEAEASKNASTSGRAFDVVLVDYDMGAHTGIELIREASAAGYPAPILLLTGRGTYEVDVQAMEAGAADYLSKAEISPGFLERAIRYAIERKKTEMELRDSEERFRALFNNHHSVMLLIDPTSGQVLDANPAACGFYGWERNEMLSKNLADINILPFDQIREKLRQAQMTPTSVSFEFQHCLANGNIRNVSVRSGPVEIGGKQRIFSIINDISEHKRVQRALDQSQARNRAFFENLGASALVYQVVRDENGKITDWMVQDANDLALHTQGVERSTLLGSSIRQVYRAEVADHLAPVLAQVLEQHSPYQEEENLNGRQYLVSTFPIDSRSVARIALDITERKQAEDRTRRRNAVLTGINRIFEQAITCQSEEDLGKYCLKVAEEVTGSQIGFVGEIDPQTGRMSSIAISDTGWEACQVKADGSRVLQDFEIHGIYGRVLQSGESFYTNSPAAHPDSIGLPPGHAPLETFLGVPLVYGGRIMGMVGLANRAGGYGPNELEDAEALAPAVVQALMSKRAEFALRRSEFALRQSEADLLETLQRATWLARLPEENPNPIVRIAYDGQFLYKNPACARLPGWDTVDGQAAPDFLCRLVEQAAQVGQKVEQDVHLGEQTYALVVVPFPEDGYVNIYARNITRRMQAEEAMKDALNDAAFERSRLLAVMEALPVGVAIIDERGGNVQANRQFEEVWSGPRPVTETIEDYAEYKAWWVDSGQPVQPEEWASALAVREGKTVIGQLLVIQRFNGERAIVLNSAAPFRDAEGKIVGSAVAIMDITEQRRAEARHREAVTQMEIQHRLMEQREKDRQAIARDIHDGPVQTLSSTIFNLQFVKDAFSDPALQLELEQIGLSVKSAVQELRQVINELRPPSLIRFGLAKTIQVHIEEIRERYPQIEWELKLANDGIRLGEPASLVLFRIYQEAVNNIVRHSGASKARIIFRIKKGQATLEIHDNGCGLPAGYDLTSFIETGHFGVAGMKERAEAAGGHLEIDCAPGKGTSIKTIIPIK